MTLPVTLSTRCLATGLRRTAALSRRGLGAGARAIAALSRRRPAAVVLAAAALAALPVAAPGQETPLFLNEELLHHPTADGVTLTLMPAEAMHLWVEWGTPEDLAFRSPTRRGAAGRLVTFRLDGLAPDGTWAYRVQVEGEPERPLHTFRTLRSPGSTFSFGVAADTHAWAVWSKAECAGSPPPLDLLERTLENIAGDDGLDFLLLGSDVAMIKCGSCVACEVDGVLVSNKTIESQTDADLRYRRVLKPDLLGSVGADLPLLAVLGDHEGEQGWLTNGIPEWARAARLKHLPNPYRTYGGGPNGNYWSMRTGDLLLVVVDVHRNTLVKPTGPELWTLGEAQLAWLERTLAGSDATFKIVVAEHLLGGLSGPNDGDSVWKGRGNLKATDNGEINGVFLGEQFVVHELMKAHGAQVFLSFQDHVVAFGEKVDEVFVPEGVTYVIGGRASGVAPPAIAERWYQVGMDYDNDGVPEYETDVTGTKSVGYFRVTVVGSERLDFEYVGTSALVGENGEVIVAFSVRP